MTRFRERTKALELRKQGKSYSLIKRELGISKSTLSVWLRDYPLSKEQVRLLRDISEVRIEKFRQTMQMKKDLRLRGYYEEAKKKLLPLTKKELSLSGLFLYWGEGAKDTKSAFSLNNTDPKVLKFTLFWMNRVLEVPKNKIKVFLHLYSDMNIEEELKFWSKELKLPASQFTNPYIKKSTRAKIDHKGTFGHGTCGLVVNDIRLKEKVMMTLKAVADYYAKKI